MPVGESIFALLEAMGGCRERSRLERLWQSWSSVVGEDLALMARPLGHKEKTLLLGADDSMDMQEVRLREAEILERVNGFLQTEYFSRLKVGLEAAARRGRRRSRQ